MRKLLVLMAGLAVAGCGADGEPVRPTAQTAVTISNNGVGLGTSLGLAQGPVTVSLGLGL